MYEDDDLAKSRIININDFIFRQNLEFYPNLRGLTCENNVLTLKENGEYITSENLTFDLRTLPGEVWLSSPTEFMDTIRLNKECANLKDFIDLMNKHRMDDVSLLDNYGREAA